MSYTLYRLAPCSYDAALGGKVVATVVRDAEPGAKREWHAQLLTMLPSGRRPEPFTELQHSFPNFEAVRTWLGRPPVVDVMPTSGSG